jgi:hypothetical protein
MKSLIEVRIDLAGSAFATMLHYLFSGEVQIKSFKSNIVAQMCLLFFGPNDCIIFSSFKPKYISRYNTVLEYDKPVLGLSSSHAQHELLTEEWIHQGG